MSEKIQHAWKLIVPVEDRYSDEVPYVVEFVVNDEGRGSWRSTGMRLDEWLDEQVSRWVADSEPVESLPKEVFVAWPQGDKLNLPVSRIAKSILVERVLGHQHSFSDFKEGLAALLSDVLTFDHKNHSIPRDVWGFYGIKLTPTLSKRAKACKHWRWLPGMRYSQDSKAGTVWGRIPECEQGHTFFPVGSLPDLADPATLGCLWALIREAHHHPQAELFFDIDDNSSGVCISLSSRFDETECSTEHYRGDTCADALVKALEEAP